MALLEERMDRAEKRLALVEERVAALVQARAEERIAELAQAQTRTEEALERLISTMTTLVEAQPRTEADVGELKGIRLELYWRERATAYLARLLRRARLIPDPEPMELLESEKARFVLSEEERGFCGVWKEADHLAREKKD